MASMMTRQLASSMERILSGWFVLELTDSPFLLGITTSLQWVPTIFGIGMLAGIVADRFDGRKILIIARVISTLPIFLIATLISAGSIQLWHLFAIILLSGTLNNLIQPVQSVLMLEAVNKRDLVNATGFQMLIFQLERGIGPAVAGVLIDQIGVAGCYYIVGAIYAIGLIPILNIHPGAKASTIERKSALRDLIEGLKYISGDRALFTVILIAGIWNFFIAPITYGMMIPIFARDVLGVGATGLGMLTGALGVGSLAASLLLILVGDFERKGLFLLISCGALGAIVFLFSASTLYLLSLALMFGMGVAESLMSGISSILLLVLPPEAMRGRVRGARTQVIMTLPFGNLIMGALSDSVSAPFAAGIFGAIPFILSILIVAVAMPKLRKQQ